MRRPISLAHFTLDENGYPVVSPNDQGAQKNDKISMSTGRKFVVNCLKKNQNAPRLSEQLFKRKI